MQIATSQRVRDNGWLIASILVFLLSLARDLSKKHPIDTIFDYLPHLCFFLLALWLDQREKHRANERLVLEESNRKVADRLSDDTIHKAEIRSLDGDNIGIVLLKGHLGDPKVTSDRIVEITLVVRDSGRCPGPGSYYCTPGPYKWALYSGPSRSGTLYGYLDLVDENSPRAKKHI